MSGILRFVAYLAAAGFLVWRAQTYMDSYGGGGDLLARIMCLLLALLLVFTGFVRALDDGSQPV
jgi:uncharacterized membrane protein YraQ (UPF0718 family)